MNLSPHFTLAELTFSEVALRKGLDNTPSASLQPVMTRLCVELLEPVRTILGVPLHINSGYRSLAVNQAVGGASASASFMKSRKIGAETVAPCSSWPIESLPRVRGLSKPT